MTESSAEPTPAISAETDQPPVQETIKAQPAPSIQIDPGLIAIAELIKEGILQNQEKEIEAHKAELRSRFHISILIIGAILTIILSIIYLTIIGKFDISTFAFLLGTSVGSLLTIMGKMFSSNGN